MYEFHLQLMKRDFDLYGAQELQIPPCCLLSVWTESSLKPKTCLSHPIPLNGIDSNTRKIYVHRYLDPVETSMYSCNVYNNYHYRLYAIMAAMNSSFWY